jgi:hypothetical protein
MNYKIIKGTFCLAIILVTAIVIEIPTVTAKRQVPQEVKPEIYKGVKYVAPHWSFISGRKQNGGYIEAWDARSGKKLWDLKVYEVRYDPLLERDAQDVFIVSLRIENDKLIVVNEKGERYEVDLERREVKKAGLTFVLNEEFTIYYQESARLIDGDLIITNRRVEKKNYEKPPDELYVINLNLQSGIVKEDISLTKSTTGAWEDKTSLVWEGYEVRVLSASCYHNRPVKLKIEKKIEGSLKPRGLAIFKTLKKGMSYNEVEKRVGKADKDIGSGIYVFVYVLDDNSEVLIGFKNLDSLFYVKQRFKDSSVVDIIE